MTETKKPEIKAATHAVVRLEFRIKATPKRVWQVLTEETSTWWDKEFVALKGSDGVILEPRLGGRLYEETPDGRSLTWMSVIGWNPGVSIDFLGCMTPEWVGPTVTMLKLHILPEGKGSVLKLTEGLLGNVTDEQLQSMHEGWTFLFGRKLTTCAERKAGKP